MYGTQNMVGDNLIHVNDKMLQIKKEKILNVNKK